MDPHAGHNMMPSATMNPHAGHMMTTANPHMHHTTPDPHEGHNMGDMGGTGMDHEDGGHMMKMFFHTGVMEYILFEGLMTSDTKGIVGACVAVFVLAVLYEGLKFFREYLLRQATVRQNMNSYAVSTVYSAGSKSEMVAVENPTVGKRMLSGSHGLQTLLHMVQVFISYCLMLIFMTYNAWLCISIILGAGVGYFLFGWQRAVAVDINEHCH